MKGFVAFRTLQNAVPFTEASAQLVCDCLNWYFRRCGKSIDVAEHALALYKLKTETLP